MVSIFDICTGEYQFGKGDGDLRCTPEILGARLEDWSLGDGKMQCVALRRRGGTGWRFVWRLRKSEGLRLRHI